jgi:hypothetical protein
MPLQVVASNILGDILGFSAPLTDIWATKRVACLLKVRLPDVTLIYRAFRVSNAMAPQLNYGGNDD